MQRIGRLTISIWTACLCLIWSAGPVAARTLGQWDFDGGDLSATSGVAMEYYGGTTASKTQFGTTVSFGIPNIAGSVASVMKFPACLPSEGYVMHTNAPGNGGGIYINQYSLVLDLLYPAASTNAWRAILQTSRTNGNDADFFVGNGTTTPNANGIGVAGQYHGAIQPNTWYRVAVTVDLTTLTMAKYINGSLVGVQSLADSLDGRWSLYSTNTAPDWLLLFADNDNDTKTGYVNSIQFRDYVMSAPEIAELGGPSANGIPLPVAPTNLQLVSPNGGEYWPAGSTQVVSWTVTDPSGVVNVELYDGASLRAPLGQAPMVDGRFDWSISPYLGDSADYRVKLSAAAFPAVSDASDAPFEVYGSAPEPTVITKLPMLQDARPDAMNLIWETSSFGNPNRVDFGLNDVSENTIANVSTQQLDATHFVHAATIQPLQIETVYKYRVRSGTATSPTFTLRTAPRPGTPIRIVWFADEQDYTIFRQQVPHMAARKPDLVLAAGDLMNDGASIAQWQDYWFGPLQLGNLAQTTPVLFCRGNHDGEGALAYAYSALPGNEAWFAFTYGSSRFIFLDTNIETAEQTAWLENELASTEAQRASFRVVSFHKPPYTDLWDGPGYNGEAFVRENWVPLFEQYKVDVVVSGHTHAYLRGMNDNVMYVIVGGAGNVVDTYTGYVWGFFTVKQSLHHYGVMEVDGYALTWNAYDVNDVLFDSYGLASQTPFCPADFDGDTDVDEDDFVLFRPCLSGPHAPPAADCSQEDIDADGDVDQTDYGLFQRCYSGTNEVAAANCAQ
ncbi:MAG TPA: metallophosphoesterase [Phycisphaerae bacterium]|nr:metallophosphoesterase [Phycisphaerae bacterium]HRR85890.1 metallophosphoesterase [Phycisphaerae bacterium]